jgi:hypothetical protein
VSADLLIIGATPSLGKSGLLACLNELLQGFNGLLLTKDGLRHHKGGEPILAGDGMTGNDGEDDPMNGMPTGQDATVPIQGQLGIHELVNDPKVFCPSGDYGIVITTDPAVQGQVTQFHEAESDTTAAAAQPQPEGDDRKAALVA